MDKEAEQHGARAGCAASTRGLEEAAREGEERAAGESEGTELEELSTTGPQGGEKAGLCGRDRSR